MAATESPTGAVAAGSRSIADLLNPRSVAVIGASEDQGKFGGRVLYMLKKHRFAGTIYPINPNRDMLLGLKAYASVGTTPTVPDLAIMAVPQPQVQARIEECAARGVRTAIIITARFSDAGAEGATLERQIVEIARNAGMRLIGPNCLGVISPANQLVLCSSPALDIDHLPQSPIGFVTQSGALMGNMFDRAAAMGVGFTHCVSVGNQADLELCDFIEFLIDDPDTRVICSYVEGLKSPGRVVELARRARAAGKPWLMVKAGRTAAGSQAAFSHTASLAGDFAALQAVCRSENIVLLDDMSSMLLLAAAMARHPGHRIDSTVLVSTSGGSSALAADQLSDAGIPLTRFADATRDRLATVYVPGQADNPVDLFGAKVAEVADFAYQSTRMAMADRNADVCLAVITTAPGLAKMVEEIGQGAADMSKPVIHVMQPGRLADDARAVLARIGLPFSDALSEAVEALRAWRAWSAYEEPSASFSLPAVTFEAPSGEVTLGESESKALLGRAGIPVNEGVIARTPSEVRERAEALGFPLVLKIVSEQIVHKTEVGGVALNLRSVGEVDAALQKMQARIAAERPDVRIDGWFLQRMASGDVELLVGARRDPQFGPMVVVASGGVLVELLKDIVLLPAPVSPTAAKRALLSLKIAPLLSGYRGAAALNIAAAVDVLVRFGVIAAQLGSRDFEIEVNPLKLGADGCMAVDARARFGEAQR